MTYAFIFPGQGSQEVGMGKALYEAFAEAKEVFQEVDDTLDQKLSRLIFEGPMEELTLTENTQPALMVTSMTIFRVLEKQSGKRLSDMARYVAGHSLGEYSALCAAGTFSLADTARLLRIRGNAMQEAVPRGEGGMAAIIGVELEEAEAIAKEAAGNRGDVCEVANDNSPGQIVISGSKTAIERGEAIAKEKGAKRYVVLPVSAPFHCSLMQPAAEKMAEALGIYSPKGEGVEANVPAIPLVTNITAMETTDQDSIRNGLVKQVTGRVRWRESVNYMVEKGVATTVEIGAGKVLSGLSKRIHRDLATVNISDPETIEAFLESL